MSFNVNTFRSQLEFGGAKPSLFDVTILNPVAGINDQKTTFMIKAASLPSSTLGEIPVAYFGRTIKLAGDRTFEPWGVTVINDEDFAVRNAMETWSSWMNSHEGNIQLFGTSSPAAYKAQAIINQYGKNGNVIRTYKFHGLFPTNIEAINMAWDLTDQIEEFGVTFSYDWWTVEGSTGTAATGLGI
jgi:hypothetical protein